MPVGFRTVHSVNDDWFQLDEAHRAEIRAWIRTFTDPNYIRSVALIGEGHVEVEQIILDPDLGYALVDDHGEVQTRQVRYTVQTPPPDCW